MTKKEKAIIMAYTGYALLTGEDFRIYHEYITKLLGRPIFTHELANKSVMDEIQDKSKNDFIKICKDEGENILRDMIHIIDKHAYMPHQGENSERHNVCYEIKRDILDYFEN